MNSFEDDYNNYFSDDDDHEKTPIYKGTLSSIFKKNKKFAIRELRLDNINKMTPAAVTPVINPVDVAAAAAEVETNNLFNSKLTWLVGTPPIKSNQEPKLCTDDYPDLSLCTVYTKKKIVVDKSNKPCPKIKDGYHCTKENCDYQHPEKKEVQEIVSNMRSLKKRVVKDVLKVIDEKVERTKPVVKKSESTGGHQQQHEKTKFCKYLANCKSKSKCRYAHSQDELKINECQYAGRCKLAKRKSDGEGYEGKCSFIHPFETRDMYFIRHQ